MLHRYLGNFHDFKCIADKCPATCCSGWLIEIDENSLKRYKNFEGPFAEEFAKRVDFAESCFKQQDNGDCAFLQKDGLCLIQKTLGEAALCVTCDSFPRHTEEFPGVREHSLSLSCPAVAEDMVDSVMSSDGVSDEGDKPSAASGGFNLNWVEELDEESDKADYGDFNDDLYSLLLKCRKAACEILEGKDLSLRVKEELICLMMGEIQDLYDMNELDKADYVLKYYKSDEAASEMASALKEEASEEFVTSLKEEFSLLFELEPLKEEFRQKEKTAFHGLFREQFAETLPECINSFNESNPKVLDLMTLVVKYFLSTYMCGAVYDEFIFSQTRQAFFNARMIYLLLLFDWKENEFTLSNESISKMLYGYCRELENSTENLIALEKLLDCGSMS